jgi:hypothetical protein
MKNIERLNSFAENDTLMQVIINLNGVGVDINLDNKKQEILDFYFVNPYEKYLFQTLVYNYIVRIK